MSQKTCRQLWGTQKNGRMANIRQLWAAYLAGEDSPQAKRTEARLGRFEDYGLCFDYVEPSDGPAYWRWQLGTGGPGDEFRFFAHHANGHDAWAIEYTYLDWNDSHTRRLVGRDLETMQELWAWFCEYSYAQEADR